ncbi:MAG TPA: FHA domain-containing protein, partial [Planctomycetaceae bacterium]|nr:FHA domain-containing protein [Planctomycetaceae bacterium]
MPALKLLKGPAASEWFPLESLPFVIGRDQQESDLWLKPDEVSRKHA